MQAGPSGVHPERRRNFDSESSVSSLRDTDSASTWLGRMRGGAGSNADGRAAGGAAGGAAGEAAGGAAGGAEGGAAGGAASGAAGGDGDPPSGPDTPPEPERPHRPSRRQRRIQEFEYANPIQIKEPKRFEGKPGEDFDSWCVTM